MIHVIYYFLANFIITSLVILNEEGLKDKNTEKGSTLIMLMLGVPVCVAVVVEYFVTPNPQDK